MANTSVFNIAKYFLSKSKPGTEQAITHLKLQKLVYYAQGYYAGLIGELLFDENLEAWPHGPVCPALYKEYKAHSYHEIPPEPFSENNIDESVGNFLDAIWQVYGKYSGPELEEMTHQETPWIKARQNFSGKTIAFCDIKIYFKNIIDNVEG